MLIVVEALKRYLIKPCLKAEVCILFHLRLIVYFNVTLYLVPISTQLRCSAQYFHNVFDNVGEANKFPVDLTDCFGNVSYILDRLLGSVGIYFLTHLDGLIYSFGIG